MSSNTASSRAGTSNTISENGAPPLSLNVPEWSQEDVCRWVVRAKFGKYAKPFMDKRVDGDLLLQMTEDQLKNDVGFHSEIERKRFMRELDKLKQTADYSSVDSTDLKSVLQSVGPELTVYTYRMLKAGVDSESIRYTSEDQLAGECGITNSIHRTRILNSMLYITVSPPPDTVDSADVQSSSSSLNVKKVLDVFISYERCTRSAELASLLRAHLEIKRYSVCRTDCPLSSCDYDDDMMLSIKKAKNFLLVLTDESLHGCIGDDECKNWMHKEIVCATEHGCNIIPVMENFTWPRADTLPADMRDLPRFNAVRWVHDYKHACVDKIEKFMLGGSAGHAAPVLRSAPNTPLMPRSLSVQHDGGRHGGGVGERYGSSNWLTVNPANGPNRIPKTDNKMSHRMSISLDDLYEAACELDLVKQETTRTDDDITEEDIFKVPENATSCQNDVMSENLPVIGMSKNLIMNKFRKKIRSIVSKIDL